MTWFGYLFVALLSLSTLMVVGSIGKPRGPLEPTAAAVIVLINALLILGAITVGTTP